MATVDANIAAALARIDSLIAQGQDFIDPLRDFENTTLDLNLLTAKRTVSMTANQL